MPAHGAALYAAAVRLALVALLAACAARPPRFHFTDVDDAALSADTIAFTQSGTSHYALALATGACRWLDDAPRYPRRRVTQPIARHVERGLTYVERAGRRVLVPPNARVEAVLGTDLVVVDGRQLVSLATHRTAPVLTSHLGEPRYVVVGARVVAWFHDALVVYDLALEEVARWRLDEQRVLPELVTANEHGIVLAEQWKLWHVTYAGAFRAYPLNDCRYVP